MRRPRLIAAITALAILLALSSLLFRRTTQPQPESFVRTCSEGRIAYYHREYHDINYGTEHEQNNPVHVVLHANGTLLVSPRCWTPAVQSLYALNRPVDFPSLVFGLLDEHADYFSNPAHPEAEKLVRLFTALHYPPADISAGAVPTAAAQAMLADWRAGHSPTSLLRYAIDPGQARQIIDATHTWPRNSPPANPGAYSSSPIIEFVSWRTDGDTGSYESSPSAPLPAEIRHAALTLQALREAALPDTPLAAPSYAAFNLNDSPMINGRTIAQWVYALDNPHYNSPSVVRLGIRSLLQAGYRYPDTAPVPVAVAGYLQLLHDSFLKTAALPDFLRFLAPFGARLEPLLPTLAADTELKARYNLAASTEATVTALRQELQQLAMPPR